MARTKALAAVLPALLLYACATAKPAALGVVDGRLAGCPSAPHCVSSQEKGSWHAVAPAPYTGGRDEARRRLVAIIRSMPRAEVVAESTDYVRAEFTSERLKYVDDVEIYLDDRGKLAHFRSSSRSGWYDFGANRSRIETIREKFLSAKSAKSERSETAEKN
jgi:uncharacterized protein (DUF1499 family)